MRKIARITRGWGVVVRTAALAFVVVKNRRRLLARVLRVWRTLLRQDRVLDAFQHRFYHQKDARRRSRWGHEAARRHRIKALQLRFLHRDQKRQRRIITFGWRGRVLRRHPFAGLLIHLQERHRNSLGRYAR